MYKITMKNINYKLQNFAVTSIELSTYGAPRKIRPKYIHISTYLRCIKLSIKLNICKQDVKEQNVNITDTLDKRNNRRLIPVNIKPLAPNDIYIHVLPHS